jgi:UDP-N-acetylmuramoylalanine--D-glutamate ligase
VLSDTKGEEALHKAIAPLRELARHAELTLELGGHQAESFRRCDFVVVSPGVPLSLECFDESRKAGIPILAEVELAYRHLKGKVVAITGTNGKTTTTTLVGELLLGAGLKRRS